MLRRVLLCLAALFWLAASACAETALCVVAGGLAMLTDGAGRPLLAGDDIDSVFAVRPGALYAAGRRGDYRLYDSRGNRLGETAFSMIDDAGDALVFCANGRYGAMDADGAVTLPAEWTQLVPNGRGGWLALDGDPLDDNPDEIVRLEGERTLRTGVYTTSGLAPVRGDRMPYRAASGLWGATDGAGAPRLEAVWRGMTPFESGLATVTGPEGAGVIDAEGREVVPPVYLWLARGREGIAAMRADGLDLFTSLGERRFSLPGENLEAALVGGALSVSDGAGVRLYAADGALLAEGPAGTTFAEGTQGQFIASDGAWGEKCQWLLDPDGGAASGRFQQLLPLADGRYAFLEMDGIEYYSAELGGLQRSWDYAGARYGLADARGRVLLPANYAEIRPLGEDRLLLLTADEATLADLDGNAINRWALYETAAPTGEGGA